MMELEFPHPDVPVANWILVILEEYRCLPV
jgi:hypothetical protein